MRSDLLGSILSDLNGGSTDIEASAVISTDGLIMAAMLPASMDEDRVGAMAAAMLSLGDRTAQELARGHLEQVLIKGDNGYVLMTHAGDESVLSVMAKYLLAYQVVQHLMNKSALSAPTMPRPVNSTGASIPCPATRSTASKTRYSKWPPTPGAVSGGKSAGAARCGIPCPTIPNWTCSTSALAMAHPGTDRKSTRLNSSHLAISYAVFCLKKKKKQKQKKKNKKTKKQKNKTA